MENLKQASGDTDTPPKFLSTILCFVALVYNLNFFQKSRYAEIMGH